jgi:hypothetical protein
MKVIEKGDGRKGWSIEHRCVGTKQRGVPDSGCSAKLLVEEDDVIIRYVGGDYLEDGDPVCCFECPQCKQVTRIQPDPPAAILRAARLKAKK